MKVLILTWDDPMPPGDTLSEVFKKKGCTVSEIKYRSSIKVFKSIKNKIVEEMKHFNPDLVFVMKGAGISPDALAELKSINNAKFFLWLVDDPIVRWKMEWPPAFREPSIGTYPLYDKVFVYDSFFVDRMTQMGLDNVDFLPCCYDDRYLPIKEKIKYDVIFYGSFFPNRETLLSNLKGLNLHVAGHGWDRSKLKNRVIPVDAWNDANLVYNQSKIVMNIHHPQSVHGANLRCFETMASGRMLITEPLKDLKEMFCENEEIVFYYNIHDLKEKLSYYLKHKKEREQIAEKGKYVVKKKHSIFHRVDTILKYFRTTF